MPVKDTVRSPGTRDSKGPSRRRSPASWLLLIPYLALLFPAVYARNTPVLWGFPFFYWYQLAWVLLTSILLGAVYRATRD